MQRLSSWKANSLSLAGRITLCSSVLLAIPLYSMQIARLPMPKCDPIVAFCRSFLWGSANNQRKIHLCKWDDVCRPKYAGGLGLRHAKYSNLASSSSSFLSKLGWGLIHNKDELQVKVLRSRNVCGEDLLPSVLLKQGCFNL